MAENAPRALRLLVERWKYVPAAKSTMDIRGGDANDLAFWHTQAIVVELLLQVERDIDAIAAQGSNVEHFRKYLPELYRFVMSFNHPWKVKESNPKSIVQEAALDMLDSLAMVVEARQIEPEWGQNNTDLLLEQLDALEHLLIDEKDIEDDSRRYLSSLIAELRQAIGDIDRYGSALIRRLSRELSGVLIGEASEAVKRTGGKRIADFFVHAARAFAVIAAKVIVTKSLELGAGAIVTELGELNP